MNRFYRIITIGGTVMALASLGLSPAQADGPQPVVAWQMGLHHVHGVIPKKAVIDNNASDIQAYLLPGETVSAWAALGSDDLYPPPPTWIKDGYFKTACTNPNSTTHTWTGPQESAKITVPPDDPKLSNAYIQWPTVTVTGNITVSPKCVGTKNGLTPGTNYPNLDIYFCYIDQFAASLKNPWACGDVLARVVLPSTTLPGPLLPGSGKTTVYQWVTKQEMNYINAHGKLEAEPNHVGEYVFFTKDAAEQVADMYKGYKLVEESFKTGSLVQASVGMTGVSGGGYFIPDQLMEAMFDIAEVAAG